MNDQDSSENCAAPTYRGQEVWRTAGISIRTGNVKPGFEKISPKPFLDTFRVADDTSRNVDQRQLVADALFARTDGSSPQLCLPIQQNPIEFSPELAGVTAIMRLPSRVMSHRGLATSRMGIGCEEIALVSSKPVSG